MAGTSGISDMRVTGLVEWGNQVVDKWREHWEGWGAQAKCGLDLVG